MQNKVNTWAILWCLNGWTEGAGYNNPSGSVIADKGERTGGIGNCVMVNSDYPAVFQGVTVCADGKYTKIKKDYVNS